MSHEAEAWAVRQRTGDVTAKFILVVLAGWANPLGQIAEVTHGQLCEATEASKATVKRKLDALRDMGLLSWFATEVEGARDGSRQGPNVYELAMPVSVAQPELPGFQDSTGVIGSSSGSSIGSSSQGLGLDLDLAPDRTLTRGGRGGRRQDPVWDAIVEATRASLPAERGAVARAKQQIVESFKLGEDDPTVAFDEEACAAEVRLRAVVYADRWPDMDLTPNALAKHWNRLVPTDADLLVFEALGLKR